MKTTVDISDTLLKEAKRFAHRKGITLRAVIERGLNRVLREQSNQPPFKLRLKGWNGGGFNPEFLDKNGEPDWGRIREEFGQRAFPRSEE